MPDTISLTGVVATAPRHVTTTEGLDITSFRLASSQRRFDRTTKSWIDTGTNWYTVTAFRQLASHVAVSLNKGDRVVANGRLRIREWESADKSGTTIEIEAEAVGHDLSWGNSQFTKALAAERAGSAPDSWSGGGPGGGELAAAPRAVTAEPAWGAYSGAGGQGAGADGFLPGDEPGPGSSGGNSGTGDADADDDDASDDDASEDSDPESDEPPTV